MADKTQAAPEPKPFIGPYLKEAFCWLCDGMVNGNGCAGAYCTGELKKCDKSVPGSRAIACPISGQMPA
jgi:hypothetical protein